MARALPCAPMENELQPLLKLEEAASLMAASPRFLRNEVAAGHLEAVRHGQRLLRFRPEAIAKWIETHTVPVVPAESEESPED